jgi:hypothetical protein
MKFYLALFFYMVLFSLGSHPSLAQQAAATDQGTSFTTKAKYTNKLVTWYEYPYWLDGSNLGDAKNKDKFNDILFKRVGNKYYKAQIQGPHNVEDWGLKRDYEQVSAPVDNSKLLQEMINYFPVGYTPSIYIPTGNYIFTKTITIDRRPVHLFGDNGTVFSTFSTKLTFAAGQTGFMITRSGTSTQETIMERLLIVSAGKTNVLCDGIAVRTRITLRDITIKGFSNNGIGFWANMEEGNDASGSLVEKCHSLENGNDGFFLGRTDANSITVIACDARDNGRYGFNDDSFLGNTFISCMAHYNKAGDFFVRDKGNARSTFISCYSEGGNKTSQFLQNTKVIGGIWGTGYSLNGKDVMH